ncbi:MAG: hypothetical protein JO010_07350, partial [Alphaproteobacteria bacterium]|nr:hypothetical protein [Alphaproteobacteria bacterium]
MAERKEAGGLNEMRSGVGGTSPGASEAEAVPSAAKRSGTQSASGASTPGASTSGASTPWAQGSTATPTVGGGGGTGREQTYTVRRATQGSGVEDIADRARGVAGQVVDDVRDAATQLLEDQKTRAADTVRGLAGA